MMGASFAGGGRVHASRSWIGSMPGIRARVPGDVAVAPLIFSETV